LAGTGPITTLGSTQPGVSGRIYDLKPQE